MRSKIHAGKNRPIERLDNLTLTKVNETISYTTKSLPNGKEKGKEGGKGKGTGNTEHEKEWQQITA